MISAYTPPSRPLLVEDLNICTTTTKQTIIGDDLNAKHSNWHPRTTNVKGRFLHKHQQEHKSKYRVVAPNEPTHYAPTGTPDVLDLFILINTEEDYIITTENVLSSDHNPVTLQLNN